MAIRGGAGTGKSFFARSMAEAGLGRLCIFDTERKSRLLKGVGTLFDGIEVEHPDELPEFIDWALQGEGVKQNYACFALDSWAAYFGAKHSETISAVREKTGNSIAQPSADELAADQMVLQGVLRKLCMESGKSVVIIDQIPARGKEIKEDNEVGRVLPMTASGLEYFVDVMVELALQERDGEIVRVFQVVKSNSDAFEVGQEFVGNITFKDFLDHLKEASGSSLPMEKPLPATAPEILQEKPEWLNEGTSVETMSIQDLLAKAADNGFKQSDVTQAARIYHNQPNIYRLTPNQIIDLDQRMSARIEKKSLGLSRAQEAPSKAAHKSVKTTKA
jgi:hypothetical protein